MLNVCIHQCTHFKKKRKMQKMYAFVTHRLKINATRDLVAEAAFNISLKDIWTFKMAKVGLQNSIQVVV